MDILDTPTLTRLAEQRGGTRISLFLPTHRGGPQTDRNRIRLKNLLRLTQDALRTDGMRTEQIDTVLAPAHHLLDRLDLRDRPGDGLALFLGPDESHHFRVPLRLADLAVIGDRFVVRPLLPLLTAEGHFYVMTLSQDEIHLLQGSRFGLEEMELEGLSLAMWLTMPRRQPQVHAFLADRGGTGGRAVFHGGGDDDSKPFMFRHFQRVDHAVRELFGDGQAPLVLAGVRFLQGIYHQANTYPQLLKAGVDGSPRDMGIADLHRRAWPLVEPVLRSRELAAAAEYRTLQGTGRTSNEPADVLTAARQGRVETLFLSTDMPDWRTPAAEPLVRLDGTPAVGADLDLAAVATLRHAGNVYAVTASRMPDTSPLTATLRY